MANEIFSYDQVGLREDLSDVIYDIAPSDTPFYSLCAKTKAQNTYHEWMTDTLRASAANAKVEGADFTNESRAQPVRLGNYSQIFSNTVEVTDTDNGMTKAGRKKQMAYEMLKVAKEQKLDIELALMANNARVQGDSVTARELAGLPAWLTTNTQFEVGGTTAGADPVTIGATARTDNVGGQTAFSQAKFDTAMQAAWDAGAKPTTCLLSSFQMNLALGFAGNNNQRSQIAATAGKVSNYMSVYLTPWGEVTFTPSRENRSRDVFIVDPSMVAVAVVRPTKSVDIAKVSDSTRRAVVTELTLVVRNEAAHAGIYDNTTA